jgi:sialate O-acetylesterase
MDPKIPKFKSVGMFYLCSLLLSVLSLRADVKLPNLISNGMVLEQGTKVNIWGAADPGERVTVTFNGEQERDVADGEGHWKVKLGPLTAGGPFTMAVAGKNTITIHDVLVGEVWVCSGQSNMAMTVSQAMNAQDEVARADYPRLRMFTVQMTVAGKPQADVQGAWTIASPRTVGDFSAVGYFFARELLKVLNVPIGMIHSSWGGTPAESWTSRATLESDPDFKSVLDNGAKLLSSYPNVFADFDRRFAQWREQSDRIESEGAPVPSPPSFPYDPRANPWRPASLFNAMIVPLSRYSIRGAIWYQGESNTVNPVLYRKLFPAMIRDWRRAWGEGDFPFLFVQLPDIGIYRPHWNWPALREAQLMALSVPKTGMAVTIDVGDGNDFHPKNKQEVGHRLALAVQAIAYGRDVIYSGPLYESMTVEGDKIRVHFKNVYGGLVAKGFPSPSVSGFEIAGSDRQFYWVEGQIEGDTIVVHSKDVPHPVAVRYAFAMKMECNLYNRAGLPASPFRTDSWEDQFPEK